MLRLKYGRKKYRIKRYRIKSKFKHALLVLLSLTILFIGINIRSNEIKRQELSDSQNILKKCLAADEKLGKASDKSKLLCDILVRQLGKPYIYGKDGPDAFDCSGLVEYAYSKIGIKLPRIASQQVGAGKHVDKSELGFGDIVFFSADRTRINHTGIYIGMGYMLHAPKSGDVVRLSRIDTGYYAKIYKDAVRVIRNDNSLSHN